MVLVTILNDSASIRISSGEADAVVVVGVETVPQQWIVFSGFNDRASEVLMGSNDKPNK